MRVNKSKWKMTDQDFGPLLPYIQNDNVTDINYNGSTVWIDDLTRGRYCTDDVLTNNFIEKFTQRVADAVSETFNQYNPLLEAETDTLRISIVHEEYANTGRSISIRKTPVIRRLTREKMVSEDYCSEEVLDFIEKCVLAKMNMLMCGLPGTGKTEFLKYLTSFIPAEDRAITIEDNLEIHYSEINPGKDCVELKVDGANSVKNNEGNKFTYVTAIKACLRQNPQWILLSEARSTEVKYLMESMSTGTHCLTTIHTDDVRKVPDRIKNMVQDSVIAARIENDVYMFLDAAILVKKSMRDGKIFRYIDQMCFFSREEGGVNELVMVVEDGKLVNKKLPQQILNKFAQANITNLFSENSAVDPVDAPQETVLETTSPEMITEQELNITPESEKISEKSGDVVETLVYTVEDTQVTETVDETNEDTVIDVGDNAVEEEQIAETADKTDEDTVIDAGNNAVEEEQVIETVAETVEDVQVTETTDEIVEDAKVAEVPVQESTKTAQESIEVEKEVVEIVLEENPDGLENVLFYSYYEHKKDDEARLRRARNKA